MTDVKIVPDAEPNAPGYWITVHEVTPDIKAAWSEGEAMLVPFIPKGHHIVAFSATYGALWTRREPGSAVT
jgi:hypothetical protein